MHTSFFKQIETYITRALGGTHEKAWPFHNIHHVRLVVDKCLELAKAYELDQQLTDELIIAAWFHDIGYVQGSKSHELQSCKICMSFINLYDKECFSAFRIVGMILATKYPSFPVTLQEKILCDADLYHLASDDYECWSERLREETNLYQAKQLSRQEWLRANIGFFDAHQYSTDYANNHWAAGKLNNLLKMKVDTLPEEYRFPPESPASLQS